MERPGICRGAGKWLPCAVPAAGPASQHPPLPGEALGELSVLLAGQPCPPHCQMPASDGVFIFELQST